MPVLVTRRLADDPCPLTEPCSERHPATVLFADISGFTALTEMLGRQGFVVARRTAAKYRESLRIPPVARRRAP